MRSKSTPTGSWVIPQKEEELRRAADSELPCLVVADSASQALIYVIERAPVTAAGDPERAPEELQHQALWMMAIAAFRTLRAAMVVLQAGYEDQAVGHTRLLDELHHRAQAVRQDRSGTYARKWLEGRPPGKAAKLVGQDMWEFLSGPVHADPRGILDWVAISDSGRTSFILGPERRPATTNATLTYMAGEARDIAHLLGLTVGIEIPKLERLDQAIKQSYNRYVNGTPDGHDGSP